MKDGLWKPSKKCGGIIKVEGGKVSAKAINDVKKPQLGASGASAPAR